MAPKSISDNKALAVQAVVRRLGQKLGVHNLYDAPKWTQSVSDILEKLPVKDLDHLEFLLEGPTERPEA